MKVSVRYIVKDESIIELRFNAFVASHQYKTDTTGEYMVNEIANKFPELAIMRWTYEFTTHGISYIKDDLHICHDPFLFIICYLPGEHNKYRRLNGLYDLLKDIKERIKL